MLDSTDPGSELIKPWVMMIKIATAVMWPRVGVYV